jgi:site-specific DNA-methyltransferase (adenine-specific)
MMGLRPAPETYYDRDGITIYHGDCLDVLPSVDPDDVDLLLTDPPYGIDLDTDYSGLNGSHRTYERVEGDDASFDPEPLLAYDRCVLWGANHYASRLPDVDCVG